MMDYYREEILDHYKHPRHFGDLPQATVVAREANASCGDLLECQLLIRDGLIVDVRFKGLGCALSIAAASMLSEKLVGKTSGEATGFDERFMCALTGVERFSLRVKCVTLPLRALRAALQTVS